MLGVVVPYAFNRVSLPRLRCLGRFLGRGSVRLLLGALAVLGTMLLSVRADLQLKARTVPTLAFTGCFSIAKEDGLGKTPLDDHLESLIDHGISSFASRHSTFQSGRMAVQRIAVPEFALGSISPSTLQSYFEKRAENDFLEVLYCLSNGDQGRPLLQLLTSGCNIGPDLGFPYAEGLSQRFFSRLLVEGEVGRDLAAELAGGYLIGTAGQGLHEIMLASKDYEGAERAVEDSKAILSYVFAQAAARSPSPSTFSTIGSSWNASLERISAQRKMAQGDHLGAIRSLLRAVDFAPYFPYEDGTRFSQSWMEDWLERTKESLNTTVESTGKRRLLAVNPTKGLACETSSDAPDTYLPPTYDLIREVLDESTLDTDVALAVETYFSQVLALRDDWLLWAEWGDLLKFLPKGTGKARDVYVARIPEALRALEHAYRQNPGFPLLPLKIGSLYTIQALASKDPSESVRLVKQGAAWAKQAQELIEKLPSEGAHQYLRRLSSQGGSIVGEH
jgi:hypothetical protein